LYDPKKFISCYEFQQSSCLSQWLAEEGFQQIFSRLVINQILEIKGIGGRSYRL
jgi:hypothetical protein